MNEKISLITSLFKIGAIQFGEFQLKSGQISPIYINLRKIISYPNLLRQIASALWEKTKQCQYNLICGVPYTALPIATCISLDHNIPMVIRRKEKKDYGTKQMIEGIFEAGQSCFIVEDIVTTGGSIIETANELQSAGLIVRDVAAFIDRGQGGKNNLHDYQFHAICTLSDVLNELIHSNLLNAAETRIVQQYIQENFS
jgi:orotate phosphoribosyltransferase